MKSIKRQIGGFYSTSFLLIFLGASALLTMQVLPVYLNEGKASKIVGQVAASSQNYNASMIQIRNSLKKRWDIDDVKYLDEKDVKLVKTKTGKQLAYKYEVRVHLFANWDLLLTFDKSYPMTRGS